MFCKKCHKRIAKEVISIEQCDKHCACLTAIILTSIKEMQSKYDVKRRAVGKKIAKIFCSNTKIKE